MTYKLSHVVADIKINRDYPCVLDIPFRLYRKNDKYYFQIDPPSIKAKGMCCFVLTKYKTTINHGTKKPNLSNIHIFAQINDINV
jgi:hypothetical protein